ncbi:unnamed protein product [Candidula unifasciata]|uniref:C2H2-type domain-containing protein n=1 Tax=Candidula unifasciata TaxID=100452 RepID=A0A8S3ZSD4_9EUPU|nr:unnamed protein product [Candidula unifasciata]
MDTYEGLIDSPMTGNSSGIADYQVPAAFPQFQDGSNMNNSYGNLSGLSGSFAGSPAASGSGLNMSSYSPSGSQQPNYGNMSSGSASSFSMPYDPPSLQQGSASHLQMAPQPSPHASHGVSNKPIHSCSYCGLVLSSANALVEHKRIHTGDRPFACHICNKRFTQKAHLNIHKRIHTGEKPYACHICNKRFAQSSHLSSHKRIHTGEKPFVCEICHIGFTQKQRLDNHLKKHLDRGVIEGLARSGQILGSAGQMEQFRQGSVPGDESAFMQMIGHGMPYIKQEAGMIRDSVAGTNSHNTSNHISSRASEGGMAGLHSVEQAGKGSNYHIGRSKRIKTESDIKEENDDDDDDGEMAEHEEGQNIAAPSFSSEGMFLHPSGYVAYGGVEDSEESNDQSPGSNPAEPLNQQGSGTAGSGHRRKPTVVRKRYSESPAKEISVVASNAVSSFQQFTPLQSVMNHGNDNSDADLDESGAEDFHDTGETLDDKNDPPYHGNLSTKTGLTPRHSTPLGANGVVETRSHSRRNVSQPLNRPSHELLNGDKMNPGAQKGGLTFTHNNSSNSGLVKIYNRISLINFTAEELITHLMKRDDVHKCQFCCLIFQDAAMYHIHRNMHDKADIRRCNMCGKLLQDKYDFTAHFLNMHQN